MTTSACTDVCIELGSRAAPTRTPRANAARFHVAVSMWPHVFHSSAWRATIRSMRGPAVPTSSGSRDWIGLGSAVRIGDRVDVAGERRAILGREGADDLDRLLEALHPAAGRLELDAVRRCSLICQPAPRPSTTRPFDMWSIVVARLASTRGVVDRRRRHERADADVFGGGGDRRQTSPSTRACRRGLISSVPVFGM